MSLGFEDSLRYVTLYDLYLITFVFIRVEKITDERLRILMFRVPRIHSTKLDTVTSDQKKKHFISWSKTSRSLKCIFLKTLTSSNLTTDAEKQCASLSMTLPTVS